MTAWAALLTRRAGTILVAALLVTAVAAVPASGLRLEADLPSLLPDGAPAAEDYRTFLETFGGLEKVFVMISAPPGETADPTRLVETAEALAEALRNSPEVRNARAGFTPEDEAFFLDYVAPRAPLLLGDEADAALRRAGEPDRLRERIQRMRETLVSPTGSAMAPLFAADPLGLASERFLSRASGSSLPVDPVTGGFLSADGSTALVIVTPSRPEVDPEAGHALVATLDAAYASVRAEGGWAATFTALGGPLYAAHDEKILREDLMRVSGGAVAGVVALVLLFCGGIAIPISATITVGAGIVWTGAVTVLGLGPVTAIGVGFGAMLVGLGDDYVNHLGAAFQESRESGHGPLRAMSATLRRSAAGIVTSSLTAAAGFGTLAFAHLRPLRELGVVVAVGMILMLIAAVTVGGGTIALLARHRIGRWTAPGWSWLCAGVAATVEGGRRFPRTVLVVAAVCCVAAAPGVLRLRLDTDPRMLRPEDHPLFAAEEMLAREFLLGMETSTVVVHGRDLGEALDRAGRAALLLRQELGDGAEIDSPSQWLAAGPASARHAASIGKTAQRVAADLELELTRAGFDPRAFRAPIDVLRAVGAGADPGLPPRASWPDWLAGSIREGPEGAAIAVHVRFPEGRWSEGPPEGVLASLRAIDPECAFASVPRLGAELRVVALRDMRVFGSVALGLVALVVVLSFRGSARDSLLAACPTVVGTWWTFGVWGAAGIPIDLFSIAVLPILLGLGIDDGLHVVHRARLERAAGISGAAASTGVAMVLSTLTTIAGFCALMLSRVPGLRHGGLLIGVGLTSCLLVTLVILPALDSLRRPAGLR